CVILCCQYQCYSLTRTINIVVCVHVFVYSVGCGICSFSMPFTCFASLLVLCNICLNIACTFDGALFLSLIFLSLHYQMFYLVMFVSAVRISSLQCFCLQFPFQVYELPNSVTPLSMVILIIIRMCFFILTVL